MATNHFGSRHTRPQTTRRVAAALIALAALAWSSPASCGDFEVREAVMYGDLARIAGLLKGNPDLASSVDPEGMTPLHWVAYRHNNRDVVELLLANKADVSATDRHGRTPLHLAAERGDKDMVGLLLANKADADARDEYGWTPWRLAAANRHMDVVGLLPPRNQEALAAMAAEDKDMQVRYAAAGCLQDATAIRKAADLDCNRGSEMRTIAELRQLMAELNSPKPVWISLLVSGTSAQYTDHKHPDITVRGEVVDISITATDGTILAQRQWTAQFPHSIDGQRKSFSADVNPIPLLRDMLRSEQYSPGQVQQALAKFALSRLVDSHTWEHATYELMAELPAREGSASLVPGQLTGPTASNSLDYGTPLAMAACHGYRDVANLLLTNGADVNAKGRHSVTPLHWSASQGRKVVTELLLKYGADVSAKSEPGNETPLHYAINKDVAGLLLANGADVNAKDEWGKVPLHDAAHRANCDVAERLLASGAGVNARDADGKTPLHYATDAAGFGRNGQASSPDCGALVRLLLASGADVNAKDNEGATPLHCAAGMGGRQDVVELLLASGADVNARDNEGHTPLRRATDWGRKAVVEWLRQHGGQE